MLRDTCVCMCAREVNAVRSLTSSNTTLVFASILLAIAQLIQLASKKFFQSQNRVTGSNLDSEKPR